MSRLKIIKMMLVILLSFSWIHHAYAETTSENNGHQWWLDLGLGVGVGNGNVFGGGTALIDGNYRLSEHQLFTVRAMQTNEIFGQNNFTDVGVLYGAIAKAKYGYAAVSAGLGWVQYKEAYGQHTGLFQREHIRTINTVGLPVELQLFVTPTPYVGIGIIGFSNVNSVKTVSGAVLALQFGNLW